MAAETVQSRATERDQKLDIDIDPSIGFAFGDVRRLRESIEHVLNNAIAYTDKKGRIRLEGAGDDERRRSSGSRDNGIGISKQDLPRVFERFDRINETGVRGRGRA